MTTNMNKPCRFCGNLHGPLCPQVKEVEYNPDGTVKRVVFRNWNAPPMPFPSPINPLIPFQGDKPYTTCRIEC